MSIFNSVIFLLFSFVRSFVRSFLHLFIRLFVCSLVCSTDGLFVRLSVSLFVHQRYKELNSRLRPEFTIKTCLPACRFPSKHIQFIVVRIEPHNGAILSLESTSLNFQLSDLQFILPLNQKRGQSDFLSNMRVQAFAE